MSEYTSVFTVMDEPSILESHSQLAWQYFQKWMRKHIARAAASSLAAVDTVDRHQAMIIMEEQRRGCVHCHTFAFER
jgi:hypothetical protein